MVSQHSKKSLQKFTGFDKLNSPKEVREHLEVNPLDYDFIVDNLQNRLTETYKNKLGKEEAIVDMVMECFKFKGNDELGVKIRNITFETNHSIISRYIHNYILEYRSFPTSQNVADETGLSRTTVYKHFNVGLHHKFSKLITGKLEYMATSALYTLYYIGIEERNASALKTFIEMSGVVKKGQSKTVNNYIQVNNLKITKEEFEQLPEKSILAIEEIISKNITYNS